MYFICLYQDFLRLKADSQLVQTSWHRHRRYTSRAGWAAQHRSRAFSMPLPMAQPPSARRSLVQMQMQMQHHVDAFSRRTSNVTVIGRQHRRRPPPAETSPAQDTRPVAIPLVAPGAASASSTATADLMMRSCSSSSRRGVFGSLGRVLSPEVSPVKGWPVRIPA
ncbi:hypothetical protein G7046_g2852 [Stylonectria norvegica]|nr:hypothetical protein G7046_g2852 [Stylonectria norvegica]